MKVVWNPGQATVRDVYETLRERRFIAYTTVMTMMKIMEQENYLQRRLGERAYVYEGTRPKRQMICEMVSELINRILNNSAEPLLAHLVEERSLSHRAVLGISGKLDSYLESMFHLASMPGCLAAVPAPLL